VLTRRLSLEFWVILCLATLPCVLAVVQLGRVQSDEIFQYLEPAFWRVHGYGMLAWEWHDGLRNWAAPIMLSWMLRLCDLVGITNPYAYRAVMELPVWLLQVAMLMAVYRFALARLNKKDGGAIAPGH
jgi:phosphatidylinositol glycan class B